MNNDNQKVYPPLDNTECFKTIHMSPPNYQPNQYPVQMMPVVTQQPTEVIIQKPLVGSTIVKCPGCQATVSTTVVYQNSNNTHLIALGLCILGCWPCCLYPYCIDSCQSAIHTCPNCNSFVGSFNN